MVSRPSRAAAAARRSIGPGRWTAVLCLAGCQTTMTRSVPTVPASSLPESNAPDLTATPRQQPAAIDANDGPVSADEAVAGDVSAGRLHDIEGTLLVYYALHHRLPGRLDELVPLADADTDLKLTAPSGRPYLYVPDGLVAPGASKRILVADPAPAARTGVRQCILAPPVLPMAGAALSMEVVAVPEVAFRRYAPAE